jgi:hypothetical protein
VTSGKPDNVVRATMAALDHLQPCQPGPARSPAAWQGAFGAALETVGL